MGAQKARGMIYQPEGEITASTVDVLRNELSHLLEEGVQDLVVDLGRVEFMDSVGLSLMIGAHISLSQAGGSLKVVNASEEMFDLFRGMRLDRQFPVSMRESGK